MESQDITNDTKQSIWQIIIAYLVLYVILILTHGYIFGAEDQIETVPLLYQMTHPEFFQNDFFIQQITAKPIHERSFYVQLIHLPGLFGTWSFFILHALSTLTLLFGLHQVSGIFIRSFIVRWVAITFLFTALYNINLGGNELYYNSLIPSVCAKAAGIWALYFSWKKNWKWAVPLFVFTTYIQPLVGIQLVLLIALSHIPIAKSNFIKAAKSIMAPIAIILLFIGPWLYFLFAQHSAGESTTAEIFEIIEFRLSHHFFPQWFSKKSYVLLIPLFFIGIIGMRNKKPFFFRFVAWALIGCLVYSIGVLLIKMPIFLNTQWFKVTIWVEALTLFSFAGRLEQIILKTRHGSFLNSRMMDLTGPFVVLLLIVAIKHSPMPILKDRMNHLPWSNTKSPEVEICEMAQTVSHLDDVFLVPPDFTMFKWHAKRATYIDYKAMIHHKDVMSEWYRRVQMCYGINLASKKADPNIFQTSLENWSLRKAGDWDQFADAGIDYIISPTNHALPLREVQTNGSYTIYALTREDAD